MTNAIGRVHWSEDPVLVGVQWTAAAAVGAYRCCPTVEFHVLLVCEDSSRRDVCGIGAHRMFGWDSTDSDEQPEATWEEFSCLYRAFLKFVTVSEFNKEEKPICYGLPVPTDICSIAAEKFATSSPLDFIPLTFLTCYTFQTYKGKVLTYFNCSTYNSQSQTVKGRV